MTVYYASNAAGTHGAGTFANPWVLNDFPNWVASGGFGGGGASFFNTLKPGDTVYLRGGTYDFSGRLGTASSGGNLASFPFIQLSVSGTASAPITVMTYPPDRIAGNVAVWTASPCDMPILGNVTGTTPSYWRFFDIKIIQGRQSNAQYQQAGQLVFFQGGFPDGSQANGPILGLELGWLELQGATWSNQYGQSNKPCLWISGCKSPRVHHLHVHGSHYTSPNAGYAGGIQDYYCYKPLYEDNYVHDNDMGMDLKDGGHCPGPVSATVRRTWLANNKLGQFEGCNQSSPGYPSQITITDSVFDVPSGGFAVNWYANGSGHILANNLLRSLAPGSTTTYGIAAFNDKGAGNNPPPNGTSGLYPVYLYNGYNNVIVSQVAAGHYPLAVQTTADNWGAQTWPTPTAWSSPLNYLDFNVYDMDPQWQFAGSGQTFVGHAAFWADPMGANFERHSQFGVAATTVYKDTTNYQLQPAYLAAGRYGDPVGPSALHSAGADVATILNAARYGPRSGLSAPAAVAGGLGAGGARAF